MDTTTDIIKPFDVALKDILLADILLQALNFIQKLRGHSF